MKLAPKGAPACTQSLWRRIDTERATPAAANIVLRGHQYAKNRVLLVAASHVVAMRRNLIRGKNMFRLDPRKSQPSVDHVGIVDDLLFRQDVMLFFSDLLRPSLILVGDPCFRIEHLYDLP